MSHGPPPPGYGYPPPGPGYPYPPGGPPPPGYGYPPGPPPPGYGPPHGPPPPHMGAPPPHMPPPPHMGPPPPHMYPPPHMGPPPPHMYPLPHGAPPPHYYPPPVHVEYREERHKGRRGKGWEERRHKDRRCAATGSKGTLSSSAVVVERRVADVLVIGAGPLAAAAALSLARRGKKVVLLPDFGIQAPRSASEGPRALTLASTSPLLTHLSKDAAAYWRGLQLQLSASQQLLTGCPTLDAYVTGPSHPSRHQGSSQAQGGAPSGVAERMTQLQESCKAEGVKLGLLKGLELQAVVPLLKGLQGQGATLVGLLQPEGGIINPQVAVRALTSLAERNGVLVRERLALAGWRDAGDHFVVRAAAASPPLLSALASSPSSSPPPPSDSASDAISVFEVEQLLLAPDESRWPLECLQLFGLDLQDLQVQERAHASVPASTDLSRLPLLRYWGSTTTDSSSSSPSPSGSGRRRGGDSGSAAADSPFSKAMSRFSVAAASGSGASNVAGGTTVPQPAGSATTGSTSGCWQYALYPVAYAGSRVKLGGPPTAPAAGQPAITAVNWQPNPARLSLEHQQRHATTLVRGLEETPEPDDSDDAPSAAPSAAAVTTQAGLCLASPDGMPIVGFHPGFERGRVVVACAVSGVGPAGAGPTSGQGGAPNSNVGREQEKWQAKAEASWQQRQQQDLRGRAAAWGSGSEADSSSRSNGSGGPAGTDDPSAASGASDAFAAPAALGDGFQLCPLLARAAADLLTGAAPQDVDPELLSLMRPSLQASSASTASPRPVKGVDSWGELQRLQSGSVFREKSLEDRQREEHEAEERRRAMELPRR